MLLSPKTHSHSFRRTVCLMLDLAVWTCFCLWNCVWGGGGHSPYPNRGFKSYWTFSLYISFVFPPSTLRTLWFWMKLLLQPGIMRKKNEDQTQTWLQAGRTTAFDLLLLKCNMRKEEVLVLVNLWVWRLFVMQLYCRQADSKEAKEDTGVYQVLKETGTGV